MAERLIPREGEAVLIQGYRFTVHNLRIVQADNGTELVRFNGIALDRALQGTGYDNAVYGHYMGARTYR